MSTSALRPAATTTGCPSWCHSHEADPQARRHGRMAGVVLRDPRIESVAIEVELAVGSRLPTIVLSVFTQKKLHGLNADLSVEEARQAHAALGEALRIADETAG